MRPPAHLYPTSSQHEAASMHEIKKKQVTKEEASSHLVNLPDEGDPLENQASLTGGATDSTRGASAATAAAFQACTNVDDIGHVLPFLASGWLHL